MARTFYQKQKLLSIFKTGEKWNLSALLREGILRIGKIQWRIFHKRRVKKAVQSGAQTLRRMKGAEPIFIQKSSRIGVLCLHGFTSTPYQFKELAHYLTQKGITVYAPLVAGHGTSPEDLMRTNAEDWKASARDAYLKLKEKVEKIVIVGNSFGGNLAFWLAKNEEHKKIAGVVSLGTPVFLRFQWITKLRLYTYGWLKTYYRKSQKVYSIDYTDMVDEITYPLIPIKSLREFLSFLKEETAPNLGRVKVPTFIIHANVDLVVHPKSAVYIHQNVGSNFKMIYWMNSRHHVVTNDERRHELFKKIYKFVRDVV